MNFTSRIPADTLSWIDNVRQRMLGMPERAYATYEFCRQLIEEEIPGCFVECGVFAGVHPAIMWKACNDDSGSNGDGTDRCRIIHLFDSFEGIPHAGQQDTDDIANELFKHGRDGALKSSGISACSLEAVHHHMEEWNVNQSNMVFHKGWVENTIPPIAEKFGPIAMLRIDVDLYSATKTVLDYLLPHLSVGGYLVLDDMNLRGCQKAVFEHLRMDDLEKIDGYGAMYMRNS